jgi:Tol biopolymer transport system component
MRNYSSSLEVVSATLGTFMQGSSTENTNEFSEYQTTYEHRQIDNNIRTAAFSPDGTQLFYLVEASNGTVGFLESVQTGTKAVMWKSVFKNLTVSWTSDNNIIIYSNPSSHLEGAVWSLNPSSGSTRVLLTKELALSAKLSPSGNKLLYSLQEDESGAFSLRVLDLNEGKFRVLPIDTMTEKCAWGPNESSNIYCAVPRESVGGDFLEDWYMGADYTDDVIWKLNVNSGSANMLLDPRETTGEEFDVVDLQTDPHEGYLIFKTRVNNALWSLKLPEEEKPTTEEGAGEVVGE